VSRPDVPGAVGRLDDLTRVLRAECPWDREQDERSIVPHTVEEAFERLLTMEQTCMDAYRRRLSDRVARM